MEKKEYRKILSSVGIKRNSVFISMSGKDKKYAEALTEALDKVNLEYWCMYTKKNGNTNKIGDEYADIIEEEIARCCVFVLLLSENSNNAGSGVATELLELEKIIENEGRNAVEVMIITIGDTDIKDVKFDLRETARKLFKPTCIFGKIDSDSTPQDYYDIAKEIEDRYNLGLSKGVRKHFEAIMNSQRFTDLLRRCSKHTCMSRTISDDIIESNEFSNEKLREAHILSNELLEYDCNTYSCMVIATNLLGNETVVNGKKKYVPEKNGVKYFYYYPESGTDELETTFEKIKSFIKKDESSRRQVVRMIRKEFCQRNKIEVFLNEFNGKTYDKFKEQYHIVDYDAVNAFKALFETEKVQGYFDYASEEDEFSVPEEVFAWMRGEDDEFSYNYTNGVVNDFISFLCDFTEMLSSAKDINSVSLESLRSRSKDLERLRDLESWQNRKIELSPAESKKMIKYLLNHTVDVVGVKQKNFPHLANWMSFDDENGYGATDEDVVEKALGNLVAVPIEDNELLRLCYSFILFLSDTGPSGAWYTTGKQYANSYEQDVVFTYDIDRQSEKSAALVDAFRYMVDINDGAKRILEKKKSRLLKKEQN